MFLNCGKHILPEYPEGVHPELKVGRDGRLGDDIRGEEDCKRLLFFIHFGFKSLELLSLLLIDFMTFFIKNKI
jgi:hypothetical protein